MLVSWATQLSGRCPEQMAQDAVASPATDQLEQQQLEQAQIRNCTGASPIPALTSRRIQATATLNNLAAQSKAARPTRLHS